MRQGAARPGSGRPSSGSASIEMAIIMPLFVALFVAVVVMGRTANAMSAVELAAYDAARTASLARDATTASTLAQAAAEASLSLQGHSCAQLHVFVDTSGFGAAVGEPASVQVEVSCVVSYADISLPGVPANRTVSTGFVSPLDQYRTRP